MENINIYVADLEAYNSGRLVGEWVSLPASDDELAVVISKHSHDGQLDIAIHDYEAPFPIAEYDSINDLNELAERVANVNSDDLHYILQAGDPGIDWVREAVEIAENGDYRIYHDCTNMGSVAAEILEENGMLETIPENLRSYFDYDAYGRDLEMEGDFTYCGLGVYVEIIR